MEQWHQLNDVVADRYQILGVLGQGGIAITYAAEDLQGGQKVALKALSLRRMQDFKVLELFEREAQTLRQLNHPAIPAYLDYFQVDEPHTRSFYLVQQLAVGQPLTALIEQGWKPDEATVQQIAVQILEILVYLQQLMPPVIHRDIKPQNIICSETGQIVLVDFGAVQDTYHHTMTGGSTVVGTYGYMAPEQFRGQAVLATDLYGLGTTLLFLLIQKPPSDLPQRKLKLQFRSHVSLSHRFADWLECLIEPVASDRFPTAAEALAVLTGKGAIAPMRVVGDRPSGSPITWMREPDQLLIKIPPLWLYSPLSQQFALLPCAALGLSLLGWLFQTLNLSTLSINIRFIGYLLFSLSLAYRFLYSATSRIQLKIDPDQIQLKRSFFGFFRQTIQIPRDRIKGIQRQPIGLSFQKQPITVCVLETANKTYRFGCFLTEPEKAWLVAELNDFIQASATPILPASPSLNKVRSLR